MIKPLTSLRFFFAFFVFLSHLSFIKTDDALFSWLQRNVFFEGYLGVSFFFILSGFVLAFSQRHKIEKNEKINKINFFKARIFRIYPLHILTFFLSLILILYKGGGIDFLKAILNIFLLQSFIPIQEYFYSFNSPSWSISDEMFFYLCFPFLFSLIIKRTTLISIIFSIIVIILLISVNHIDLSRHKYIYYVNPITRLLDFVLGIFLFKIYTFLKNKKINLKNGTLIESLVIILFIIFFLPHKMIERAYRYATYYWIPMSLFVLVFSLQKGWISKLLSHRFLVYLGEISFAFYMLHLIIINVYQTLNLQINYYFAIPLILIVTIVLSSCIFEFFEKPVNKYLKTKFIK